jgi:hypothetical protein
MKKIITLLLMVMITMSSASFAFATENDWDSVKYAEAEAAVNDTANYIIKNVPNPEIGSTGGEWSIIGLKASGYDVSKEYYDSYYNRVETYLRNNQGILTQNKYTEYSRLIIALTSIGKDVANVAGYNLLEKLADFDNVKKQGINGPVYALIALDCHDYEIPKVEGVVNVTTRQGLIDYILEHEITDENGIRGGFSLGEIKPDADITGMALQSLANYRNDVKVEAAIDRGIKVLSRLENADGNYASWSVETSESIVQVILAKTALNVDASKDIDALLKYYNKGSGFEHVYGQGQNLIATEEGLCAISAYKLRITENRSIYNLNSINIIKDDTNLIHIILNGKQLEFDQSPIIVENRILVPMRAVFEALGADVFWNNTLKEAMGTLGNKSVVLKIGSKTATISGIETALDVPAQIINERTLVPLRFVAESLDSEVDWNSVTRTVYIDKKD